jgi:hypothetical protein
MPMHVVDKFSRKQTNLTSHLVRVYKKRIFRQNKASFPQSQKPTRKHCDWMKVLAANLCVAFAMTGHEP